MTDGIRLGNVPADLTPPYAVGDAVDVTAPGDTSGTTYRASVTSVLCNAVDPRTWTVALRGDTYLPASCARATMSDDGTTEWSSPALTRVSP